MTCACDNTLLKKAYDEVLLARASDVLGRMLDYSVYSLRYDIATICDLFVASGVAALFEHGDIRTIAGLSGIELAYEVIERSGIVYERTQPRYTKAFSPEYWYGNALALIQWETCLSFDRIAADFNARSFISDYSASRLSFLDALPLNITEEERFLKIKEFGKHYSAEAASRFISDASRAAGKTTALKSMRLKSGLSQSGLAKASGIPVRTIQQYEQSQKDLSKARAEYLIALSRALNCDPAHLLER